MEQCSNEKWEGGFGRKPRMRVILGVGNLTWEAR
jgi:hypothetical protein